MKSGRKSYVHEYRFFLFAAMRGHCGCIFIWFAVAFAPVFRLTKQNVKLREIFLGLYFFFLFGCFFDERIEIDDENIFFFDF